MNWSEFFSMGGRGFYVWGSYVVTFVFLLIEIILLRQRRKQILKKLRFNATNSTLND